MSHPTQHAEAIKIAHGCALPSRAGQDSIEVPSIGERPPRQLSRQTLPLLIDGDTFTRESPETIANQILDLAAPNRGDAFALSFDLDVIDPKEAPGVNLKSPNGLDPDTVFRVLERLAQHGGCQAMDIVELDPTADDEHGTTAGYGVQAARVMFGRG